MRSSQPGSMLNIPVIFSSSDAIYTLLFSSSVPPGITEIIDILMSQGLLLTPPMLSVKLVFGRCLDDHRLRSFGCLVCPGY
jgi:hypothetical protein